MKRAERGARARRRGRRAEFIAAWLLRIKGFRILARDLRGRTGELDIVARRGGMIVFVEVKARRDEAEAGESLRAAQRARILRAASAYLAQRPDIRHLAPRFDAVLFGAGVWPRHVPDAWRESP